MRWTRESGDHRGEWPCAAGGVRRIARALFLGFAVAALLETSPATALDPERALSQYQVDVWQTEHGLPQNTVTSIVRTRDGNLWFGTYEGLVRFDGATFTVFDGKTTPLLAKGTTFALMEDRKGGLWIGRSENVVRYEGGVFEQLIDSRATGQGTSWSICEAADGTVWIAGSKGLVRVAGETMRIYGRADGLPSEQISALALDATGSLWVGTWVGGLDRLRDRRFAVFGVPEGLSNDNVRAVLHGRDGSV